MLFNLIPAFPMDGGRVLRALLDLRLDYVRAMLIFISLFVWIGAQQEASMVQIKSALGGIPVRQAKFTEFKSLRPSDSLRQAADYILGGSQQGFPVLEEECVVGILTRSDLLVALSRQSEASRVNAVMRCDFETVHPGDMLEAASIRLQVCNCLVFPVIQDGRLVGLLTMENIDEFLIINQPLNCAAYAKILYRIPLGKEWFQTVHNHGLVISIHSRLCRGVEQGYEL